jgi:glycosyltransferase involved in cell wall biosynthesis
MKVLHLDQINANPESSQQKTHQTVKGADVFEWNLLCALLEYGTYDKYLTAGLTEEKKQALVDGGLASDKVKRLLSSPVGTPLPVADSDQLVFVTAGRYLNALGATREKWRRYDAPACGFIHSINSPRIALALLQQCFVGLSQADLLLCSSRAGMKTINVYIEEINGLLQKELHYPVRRVVVPLGVYTPGPYLEAQSSLRHKLNIEGRAAIALYFGRLSRASKCDLGPLLVALSQLLKRGKKLHLIIAGDDTQTAESPRLQALANELDCQRNIRIWANPSANDKHLLYSGADFFLSPSDNMQETFGIAVAEAMAYGLPAVVSDWDGYRDLVQEGETGFLIPSLLPLTLKDYRLCDCPTSMLEEDLLAQSTTIDVTILSHRMEKLATDSDLRREMGLAAKRFIERCCTWRVVVKRYEELWEEALMMAKAKNSRSSQSSRLLNLPLEKCFGHYASGKQRSKEKCFITSEGQEWLKRPGRFYFLNAPCPQQFMSVLRLIADYPGTSSDRILEEFSKDLLPEGNGGVDWILTRLFKYGLVAANETRSA